MSKQTIDLHASSLFFSAVKELAAFFTAVDVLFGTEQARKSANHWIEELELMDWPSDESMPNWRQATLGASARLGTRIAADHEVRNKKSLKRLTARSM